VADAQESRGQGEPDVTDRLAGVPGGGLIRPGRLKACAGITAQGGGVARMDPQEHSRMPHPGHRASPAARYRPRPCPRSRGSTMSRASSTSASWSSAHSSPQATSRWPWNNPNGSTPSLPAQALTCPAGTGAAAEPPSRTRLGSCTGCPGTQAEVKSWRAWNSQAVNPSADPEGAMSACIDCLWLGTACRPRTPKIASQDRDEISQTTGVLTYLTR
jgi:hypothetical protein